MYTVILKKNEEKKILKGYPWVFANEVQKVEGKDLQGSVAEVRGFDGRYIGKGFINHASKIFVRILTLKNEEIGEEFYRRRIVEAINFRKSLGYDNNYRVIFAESDRLPGLIVDKYGDYLSVQFLSLGMEKIRQTIIKILTEELKPLGIYERSDVAVRRKEGLKERKGVILTAISPKVFNQENGLKISAYLETGLKT